MVAGDGGGREGGTTKPDRDAKPPCAAAVVGTCHFSFVQAAASAGQGRPQASRGPWVSGHAAQSRSHIRRRQRPQRHRSVILALRSLRGWHLRPCAPHLLSAPAWPPRAQRCCVLLPHCAQSRLKRGLPGPRRRRWQRAGTSPYRGLCARRPEPGGRRAVRCGLRTAACAPRALPRWGGAALPPRPSARPAVSNR